MTATLDERARRADSLYDAREDGKSVRESLGWLEEVEAAGDYEILWRLGRAHFFLGQESGDEEEARSSHRRGVNCSARAAALSPHRVEGHFWLGVNLSLLAKLSNPLAAALLALRARRALLRAVRLDAGYHAAGPLRVLAHLESHLPRLLGGGHQRARTNFQRAVRLAPHNTVTRIYFARLLVKTGDTGGARAQLEAVINSPMDPAWAFEAARDRRLAREMLKDLS
jgi:hypothetical protein